LGLKPKDKLEFIPDGDGFIITTGKREEAVCKKVKGAQREEVKL
jgi:bifunctional DNA-binding transcriptional regulator/antitoxin component of YhaV-PrlF toxin-antitoxin module